MATYGYMTSDGTLVFEVVRYDAKDFRQRRPDGKGGWIWNLKDVPKPYPLYRLPELLRSDQSMWIYVVEGEKDVDNLRQQLGIAATCNPGGAGKWNVNDSPLASRKIAIIADKDAVGRKHALLVAEALSGRTKALRILELPGEKVKDSSDWLESLDCKEPEELRRVLFEMAEAAPEWKPTEPGKDPAPSGLEIVCFADIPPEELVWLWPNRIPLGKLTLLVGDPDLGKSTVTIWLAAQISTGASWPDCPESNAEKGKVLILSAEDGPADTMRPRLDLAGAAVENVFLIRAAKRKDGRQAHFDLRQDLERLGREISRLGNVCLLIVDPISAYVGSTDDHRNAELRGLLAPLSDLAARHKLAVLAISHLRKGGGRAIHATMGSMAYAAAARAVWCICRDRDNSSRHLFLPVKANLSRDTSGLAFEIGDGPRILWQPGRVDVSADDAMSSERGESSQKSEAADFLCEVLADGPVAASEVVEQAGLRGIAKRTLDRAKNALNVESHREGYRDGARWVWALPEEPEFEG